MCTRMMSESRVPAATAINDKSRYWMPMTRWLVVKIHRRAQFLRKPVPPAAASAAGVSLWCLRGAPALSPEPWAKEDGVTAHRLPPSLLSRGLRAMIGKPALKARAAGHASTHGRCRKAECRESDIRHQRQE